MKPGTHSQRLHRRRETKRIREEIHSYESSLQECFDNEWHASVAGMIQAMRKEKRTLLDHLRHTRPTT